MDQVLNISPGLTVWTLINFVLFLFLLGKFAWKPIIQGLKTREGAINDAIVNAERANQEAQRLLKESETRMTNAQAEMAQIIREGRQQAENYIRQAADEAEKVKVEKLAEAQREIQREKDAALAALRTEVATLVVQATEKVLGQTLDQERHGQLIESYIDQVSRN